MGASVWISLVLIITLFNLPGLNTESQNKIHEALEKIQTLDKTRKDISNLVDTINSIEDDLVAYQKRTCALGINSHHCSLADLDDIMKSSEWLKSGFSPGKRTVSDLSNPNRVEKAHRIIDDIVQKRNGLARIKALLQDADDDIMQQKKRTCQLELGGTCRTEMASAIADQYYYLGGPHSPGRRKRSAIRLFQKRIKS